MMEVALDPSRPSLFGKSMPLATVDAEFVDLLAAERLALLIPACLRYLLTIATRHRPRYLLRLLNSFDEIYALVALVVQRHYLSTTGASFLEHYYGLVRERPISTIDGQARRAATISRGNALSPLHKALRPRSINGSLFALVIIPYIKRKLDDAYDRFITPTLLLDAQPFERDGNGSGSRRYYHLFLRQCYPYLNTFYHATGLAFGLAYLFGHTRYASPLLWLAKVQLRRLTPADLNDIAVRQQGVREKTLRSNWLLNLALSGSRKTLQSLQMLLPAAVFALQFLEWWQASDIARQFAQKTRKLYSPPHERDVVREQFVDKSPEDCKSDQMAPVSQSSGLPIYTVPECGPTVCPICLRLVQTPTLAQTGYVYCYVCIFKWVQGSHERQEAFMRGTTQPWSTESEPQSGIDRHGSWENGEGRCAITGRKLLGGTSCLRRLMV